MLRIALVAALALVAFAPVASADPVGCSFGLWFWHADYDCHVLDAGAEGTVVWCPIATACGDVHVTSCSFETYPYWYCTVSRLP
ncbi:MAG TPA: hypothetical protein VHH36_08615 [Candidatus Thermoplasmatota archaeon]|nr:hypothetical protein [Candidatus Thermoplasmatota archaeon]